MSLAAAKPAHGRILRTDDWHRGGAPPCPTTQHAALVGRSRARRVQLLRGRHSCTPARLHRVRCLSHASGRTQLAGGGRGGGGCSRACVGVRVMTKLREMERQSPLPYLASPMRNRRCSSSVQGMPLRRSVSWLLTWQAGVWSACVCVCQNVLGGWLGVWGPRRQVTQGGEPKRKARSRAGTEGGARTRGPRLAENGRAGMPGRPCRDGAAPQPACRPIAGRVGRGPARAVRAPFNQLRTFFCSCATDSASPGTG